jgi:hypothetical protein
MVALNFVRQFVYIYIFFLNNVILNIYIIVTTILHLHLSFDVMIP